MSAQPPLARLAGVTIRGAGRDICRDITLSVAPGSFYVLLGRRGSGKTSLTECLLGWRKPAEGAAYLFERPSREIPRASRSQIGVVAEEARNRTRWSARLLGRPPRDQAPAQTHNAALARALAGTRRLLIVDEPDGALAPADRGAMWDRIASERTRRGMTIFAATSDPAALERNVTDVGILKDGRLIVNEPWTTLKARFRRLIYSNEITPERTEYGNELDEFDAVRVRVRGWGIDAVVSNFDDRAFERFTAIPGLADARARELSLEEIFRAVVGEERPVAPR